MSKLALIAKRTGASVLAVTVLTAIVVGTLYGLGVKPYRVYIVHTGSMGNTIPSGSAVIVRANQYHVGQVVSFTIAGEVVTHRLISLKNGLVTTKGDANPSADPWQLPRSSVIGGVVAAPRDLGFVLQYLRLPSGMVSIALLVVVFWLCLTFPGPEEAAAPEKAEALSATA